MVNINTYGCMDVALMESEIKCGVIQAERSGCMDNANPEAERPAKTGHSGSWNSMLIVLFDKTNGNLPS